MLTTFLIGAAKVAGVGVAVAAGVAAVRHARARAYASQQQMLQQDGRPGVCRLTQVGGQFGNLISPLINGQVDRHNPVGHYAFSCCWLVLAPQSFALAGAIACVLMLSGCVCDTAIAHRMSRQLDVVPAAPDGYPAAAKPVPLVGVEPVVTEAVVATTADATVKRRPRVVPLAELRLAGLGGGAR